MMDSYCSGKVAVVTGAGGTLCSEIAVSLAEKGAKVVLIGRSEEKLKKTAGRIASLGGIYMIKPCDVLEEPAMQKLADEILSQWGPCSILVNGAGGNNVNAMTTNFYFDPIELTENKPAEMRCLFDLKTADFEKVLLTNTMGTMIPTRIFAAQMAKNGGGSILNFASMNSYRPLTRVPAYAMAKAAVINMTQWFATYLAPAGIRVNAVAPGFFINERSRQYLGSVEEGLTQRGKNVISHTPQGNFGQPENLLGAVHYLLDDTAASFTTGITIPVDGGFLAHSGI